MPKRAVRVGFIAGALCASACSASPEHTLGSDGSGGSNGTAGSAGGSGGVGVFTPVDGGLSPLTARIVEPPSSLEVSFVTISCAGECKDVLAVPSGGNPDYTFAWNDGVTMPARPICATVDADFSVTVADTPDPSGEFPYQGQTATASVRAEVLECPADGGADASGPLEPTTCAPVTVGTGACNNGAGVVNTIPGVSLSGGETRGLRIAGNGSYLDQPWHYELWGSNDGCSLDEKLAEFQLVNGPFDLGWCVTPSRDFAQVVLFYRYAPTDGLSLTTWSLSWCGACSEVP